MDLDALTLVLVVCLLAFSVTVVAVTTMRQAEHRGESPEARQLRLAREAHVRTQLRAGRWLPAEPKDRR
jgi:hypothetical protein